LICIDIPITEHIRNVPLKLYSSYMLPKSSQEYTAYHQLLQDTEKWLLQISFQLMAHNSLYITNREQTQEQIFQHEVCTRPLSLFCYNRPIYYSGVLSWFSLLGDYMCMNCEKFNSLCFGVNNETKYAFHKVFL
jgi:hypothetical protein